MKSLSIVTTYSPRYWPLPIKKSIEMASEYNISPDEIKKIQSDALNEVNEAFDFAETQPWPKPEDALEDVYVNYPRELLI